MSHRLGGKWVGLCGAVAVVSIQSTYLSAFAADWPQWRGPNRDGVSAETLNITNWPPLLAWSSTLAPGESALAVSEGRVYTMGRSGPTNFVYCLDASTGTNLWTQTYLTNGSLTAYGSYGPQATPSVSGGAVYTFDDGGKLYCFNKTNGTVLWNTALNLKRPQYAFSSSPLIEDNLIYLNGSGAGAAVGKTTHTLAWPTGTLSAGSGYASAVGMTVGGKRLILFQTETALKAMTTNGVLAWSYPYDSGSMSGYAAADPVVWDDSAGGGASKILLYENGLVLLQATTNSVSEVWPLNPDAMGASFGTPVIVGSYAYAVDYNGDLVRIRLADGTVDWNLNVSAYGQGVLTAAGGKLIVMADGQMRIVTIGASGFDEEGRTPVTVAGDGFQNYAWSPPALYNGRIYCRVGQVLACYSISGLMPGPNLSMDTNDVVVLCPLGTEATQAVSIVNAGDATLTWTLSERYEGANFSAIMRQFKSGWTKYGTAPALEYDATNSCLWTADYSGGSELAKLSTVNGSVLATKSMGTNCAYGLGGLESDGTNLWVGSYSPAGFKLFRLSDMALLQTVPVPSGWSYICSLAIGEGKWWSTKYDYSVCRVNPASGAVISSFASPDSMTYQRHIAYRNGSLWWGSGQSGFYNVLRRVDANSGAQQTQIQIGQFSPACTIHDVTFQTDTQVWLLTYRHSSSLNEYWAHLVDISGIQRLSKSAVSGAVPAGASAPLSLVLNGVGATLGLYPIRMTVTSNGGTKEKLVTFVVHAAGVNHAPTANAGPDQTMDAAGATTAVTLNGSGSSDSDGDTLRFAWSKGGVVFTNVANPALSLAPGVHDFTLTVDDYRGGVATDTVRITINAADIAFVDEPVVMLCPQGSVVTQTVTVLNVGSRTLNWTMTDHLDGTNWVPILKSFKIGWNLSTTAMKFDATNNCLWTSYYYSNEVAKISTANGSVLARKYLAGCPQPYAIETEGTNLWVANYSANNFSLYEMGNATVLRTVAQPSGWSSRAWGLAMGGGNWYSTTSGTNVYRLNPSTGAVLSTWPTPDYFYYYSKHFGYGEGNLWWGRSSAVPYNVLRRMDAASGQIVSSVQVGSWNANATIYDVSYTGTNSQYWVLSYYHNGAAEYWAHLVDLSGAKRVTESVRSGSIGAGGSTGIQVVFDGRGLARGSYPAQLLFTSNDPDERLATNTVMVVVHAPGVNHPPVANAGPDRTQGIIDPTAPFIMDLSGAGSSDPDGDPIRCRWTTNGVPVVVNQCGLVELGVGANTFTLTVDDYRGGTNTDAMVLTVTNAAPRDWPEWYGPLGTGISPETNWLQNWPPIVAWRRPDINQGGYSGNSSLVVSEGRVYHSGQSGMWCLDAKTGATIWQRAFGGANPTPAVDEDRVYAVGKNCTTPAVSCWDKRTGANLWNTTINTSFFDADGAGYYCSPMVYGDLVYLDTAALNKRTGAKVWTRGNGYHMGRRHMWNGRTHILAGGNMIDPMTGANVQSVGYTVSWWLDATSTYEGDKVWLLNSLRYINGSTIWSTNHSFNSEIYIQPTVVGDFGYFLSGCHGSGGPIKCQDLRTGKLWYTGPGWGTWIATGDDKLIAHGWGNVAVIKAKCTSYVEEGRSFRFDLSGGNAYPIPAFADKRIFVIAASGLTCLYTGLSAPVIDNGNGAVWNCGTGTAELHGSLINTGGAPVQVWMYWGRTDGGTNAGQWEHCEALGTKTVGDVVREVSALETNQVYYYRSFAANSIGGTWAADSKRFDTCNGVGWDGVGMVLHWALDEGRGTDAYDTSGNGNHGYFARGSDGVTLTRDVWTTGAVNHAVAFYGAERVWRKKFTTPVLGDFTFMGWLSYTNVPQGNGNSYQIAGLIGPNGLGSMSLTVYDSSRTGWNNRMAGPAGWTSRALHDGQWHHVATVREGLDLRMYVDGVLDAQSTIGNPTDVVGIDQLWISGGPGGAEWMRHDDIRLYKRALSADEVRGLYQMRGADQKGVYVAASGSDDAEELANGTVSVVSPDLDMARVSGTNQTVGVRFGNISVPRGAAVLGASIQFRAVRDPGGKRAGLSQGSIVSYGAEDTVAATATVSNGGRTITLLGNAWKAYPFPYTVTTNTVLEFDFRSTTTGDVHGIGMDSQTITSLTTRVFALYGAENRGINTYKNYASSAPNVKRYVIPIGKSYTGAMTHVVFMNDDDGPPADGMSEYSDITVYENLPQAEVTWLTIRGQAADNAAAFAAAAGNLTARPATSSSVFWDVPTWVAVTNPVPAQATPDLKAIVQEIVDRDGWASGNAIAFMISGTGCRIADAIDNPVGTPARLSVSWTTKTDANGNGVPDVWERRNFGTSQVGAYGPAGDNDGDGYLNANEFVAGTDPDNNTSLLAARTGMTGDGKLVVRFDVSPAAGIGYEGMKRYYTLQVTTNLIGSPWTNVTGYAHIEPTAPGVVEYTNTVPTVRSYYRVRVDLSDGYQTLSEMILPMAGTVSGSGTNILLWADAWDQDGTVTKVEFYSGAAKLGETNSEPFRYTWVNPSNGIHSLSAVAYDNSGHVATSAPVSLQVGVFVEGFVGTNTTAQGTWKGVFGQEGCVVVGNAQILPAWATVTAAGKSDYTWSASTTDTRALQKASPTNATDRVAACWYSSSSLTIDVDLSDGQFHKVSIYCLDWDNIGRRQKVEVFDKGSGTLLDTRTLGTAYNNGVYLTWRYRRSIQIKVTSTGAGNGVVSGVFLGPP